MVKKTINPTVRLIFGIIFIVVSVIAFFQSLAVNAAFSLAEDSQGSDAGSYGLVAAILMLIIGIIFLAARKSNAQAIKISTWIMGAMACLLAFTASDRFSDMGIYAFFILVGVIWSNLTFRSKDNKAQKTDVIESTKSNTEEIAKFKVLLDDGAITQEEFDAKKQELLKL